MEATNEHHANPLPHHIGVVGLGYVGLPLALLFARKGFRVVGIDVDHEKINQLNQGMSNLSDINIQDLKKLVAEEQLKATSDYSVIEKLDAVIICVPTPLTMNHDPDLHYLIDVGESIIPWLQKNQLIVLESSTYPGTTREVLKPILEKSGLRAGNDFFLAFSPERLDPGNKTYQIEQVPKIVSGISKLCTTKLQDLYSKVFEKVVPVSTTETAEMAKLLENSYRFINISFINEFAMNCSNLNIDVWEVIEAASTKPFGFSPFYPGPGVGGHCIPVDPIYLLWKLRKQGLDSQFITLADQTNKSISEYMVRQLTKHISETITMEGAKLLLCGVSYKKDINDWRESPAMNMIRSLHGMGVKVFYHDPYINEITVDRQKFLNTPLTEEILQEMDCVVIHTDHSSLPIQKILDNAKVVYDTRNSIKGLSGKAKVIRFGAPSY